MHNPLKVFVNSYEEFVEAIRLISQLHPEAVWADKESIATSLPKKVEEAVSKKEAYPVCIFCFEGKDVRFMTEHSEEFDAQVSVNAVDEVLVMVSPEYFTMVENICQVSKLSLEAFFEKIIPETHLKRVIELWEHAKATKKEVSKGGKTTYAVVVSGREDRATFCATLETISKIVEVMATRATAKEE